MPETQDLSDQLVRSFMIEKLQFAPSLVSNMKFTNVHRLPRRTDASRISNSTSKRPPPIVVKFCTMRDKMEVLKLARQARQFHCAITKHLLFQCRNKGKVFWHMRTCYSKQERKFNERLLMRIIVYLRMASGRCRKCDQCPVDTTNLQTVIYNKDKHVSIIDLVSKFSVYLFIMAVRTLYDCTLYIYLITLCLKICLATQKLLLLLLNANFQLWRVIPVVSINVYLTPTVIFVKTTKHLVAYVPLMLT